VNGAAAAACDEMAETLPGAGKVEGVKAGESKFSDFFLMIVSLYSHRNIAVIAKPGHDGMSELDDRSPTN
jgi:hypothetical protein